MGLGRLGLGRLARGSEVKAHNILITGATKGIGRAVALQLARGAGQGVKLALAARDATRLDELAAELRSMGDLSVHAVPMDVGDPEQIEVGLAKIRSESGPLDAMVLSAGISDGAPLAKTSDELFERIWQVNVRGVFQLLRAVVPSMAGQGYGRVVVLGSIASHAGAPFISAYCASKHAVLGLVRSVALEFAASGVTVNAVCPGYVDSPMTHTNMERIAARTSIPAQDVLQRILKRTPQGRLYSPEEVAACVCFLLSDAAGGINGVGLEVDGGELAR